MRKLILKALLCLLIIPTAFVSCTTGDDSSAEDESVEGELNSELEELPGDDAEDGATSADADADASAEDDLDLDEGDSSTAGSDDSELEGGDDDFFAEDADKPSGAQDAAEKDLQTELDKSDAPADATVADAAVPVEPAATTSSGGGSSPSSVATSKESGVLSPPDGFEAVPPPTLQLPNEDLGISDPLVADVDPPLPGEKAAKEAVPVSKVRKEPFITNGRLMNAVYIVRQGDDPGTISQKLFDKDQLSILAEDNPDMRARGVNIGDKIYYTSPNRPDDKKQLLTYYEDKKMPTQYYTTKDGDNIKKIGREVLGHDDAWKEIWATNDVLQTQAMLPAGMKIRYWSGNEAVAPPEAPIMASNDIASSDGGAAAAAGSVTENTTPAPPSGDAPAETLPDLADSSPVEDPGMQSSETTPMPTDIGTSAPAAQGPTATKEGNDSLLTIAAISLIGLAVLALVAIQIKNRKRDDGMIPPSMEFTKV